MNLFNRPFPLLMITTLTMSTLMMLSSSNWLFLWCALEINLLSFIPLIMTSNKFQENEAATKYFLIQALGSSLILLSSTTLWNPSTNIPSSYILTTALLLKLGMAPCHFWFPSVMSSMSWSNCLILATWQKLGPLSILSFIMESGCSHKIMLVLAPMNALIGGIMGINQSKIKSIMAYSSITHMGWMLSLLTILNPLSTMIYYIMYSMTIMPLFLTLNILSVNTQPQLQKMCSNMNMLYIIMPLMIMSISGIPPLTGFFPKLMTISLLLPLYPTLTIILIMGAMMNLFFYLNLTFSIMISPNTTLTTKLPLPKSVSITSIMSAALLLPMCTLLWIYAMTMLN